MDLQTLETARLQRSLLGEAGITNDIMKGISTELLGSSTFDAVSASQANSLDVGSLLPVKRTTLSEVPE